MNGTTMSHQILSLNETNNSTWIEASVTEDENEEAASSSSMSINRMISYYGEGILLTAVSIFGLVGNLMSIVVLTRSINSRGCHDNSLRSISGGTSFTNLLRGLASFDALFLTVAIMSFGLPKISPYYFEHIFQHIMVIVYGLLHTFRVGSVYVTLAVTFERFHAIICPLRHFKWKKYMLPFCICFAVVYNIPKYFELQMVDSSVKSTAMRENKFYVSLYLFWSKFLFIEVFPYTTILIMNIFIIIKITKSARFRKKFQRQNVDDEGENYLEVAVPLNENSSNGLKSFEQGLT